MEEVKSIPMFEKGKVYVYHYMRKKRARTERNYDCNFRFVGTEKGDGVTHFMFQHTVGGYLITFTERDFISGDVKMVA